VNVHGERKMGDGGDDEEAEGLGFGEIGRSGGVQVGENQEGGGEPQDAGGTG